MKKIHDNTHNEFLRENIRDGGSPAALKGIGRIQQDRQAPGSLAAAINCPIHCSLK
jgi:hypothetical protein